MVTIVSRMDRTLVIAQLVSAMVIQTSATKSQENVSTVNTTLMVITASCVMKGK